ncbi:MAG: hypothetical protein KY476_14880 [Planctomycetes bacterium]|nr:hypothetical protein [Planctomycetota bacterium]
MLLQGLEISDEIERDAELRALVDQANDVLGDALGPTAHRVTAHWAVVSNGQREPILELQLADDEGSIRTRLSVDELSDKSSLWWHLYRLWGTQLRQETRRQLERLHLVVQELADE